MSPNEESGSVSDGSGRTGDTGGACTCAQACEAFAERSSILGGEVYLEDVELPKEWESDDVLDPLLPAGARMYIFASRSAAACSGIVFAIVSCLTEATDC